MRAYFDSGLLFKLYWQEANTPAAQAIVQNYQPPILLSRLNEVEMLHVARRKTWLLGPTGQSLLTAAQFQAGLALLEQDLTNGIVARLDVNYDEVFDSALELSRKHGQTIPVKTADLLHVAMMEFGFDEFVTADKQQHDFATRAGVRSVFLPP
ncbi:MAG: type II toxin-antitoxin system VapC family toxin [Verrucomicrobia bacterium]|nr:type II toxin-antitoxin system VapC family toxin [Verrucomicrobiota bacterium]